MLNTALLQQNLEKRIKEILNTPISEKSSDEEVKSNFAQKLSTAIASEIDAWIRQATVTIQPGQAVSTPSGPGVTTSPGQGTIA